MVERADVPTLPSYEGERSALEVALLGPLTITRSGSEIELIGPKRRALLIFLALHIGTPMSRDRIVEALWPGQQTGREEATLQVHVSHLRDQIEPSRQGAPRFLVTRDSAYMLAGDAVDLDISRFDRLAARGRDLLHDDPEVALEGLNEALALWRGRPLHDVEYEEFAQDEIRRLEGARVDAIENRAEALVELNRDPEAIADLEALIRDDPTRERPVSLLMKAFYRSGRQAEALRVFRRHSRQLVEHGLDPSPQISFLEERILQHDPSLLPEKSVSPAEIGPGHSIRGYELREKAGSGAVGVVYRAFQAAVGREVAVKVVHPDMAQSPEFVRRFAEEARLIAGLEHPHIVPLHDFWREPAGAFLVMRWMDGGSLDHRLREPWELDELSRIFDQLADALGYAHSAGVVHRDVKPANVLFDKQGNAYLSDFSLAATGIDTGVEGPHRSSTIEPPYSPPELIRGEGPTVAGDIYALGVLLAEVASGARFPESGPTIPVTLREVVSVATAANPADRFPDTAAFRSALGEAVGPMEAPAPRKVRRNPYKGLEAFDEGDRADFYGREDVVDTLIDLVRIKSLVAIIGASGSGKSSLVKAGLVPQLRDGALPGSEEWSIVHMVPGTDPFEEFHLGLREAAVSHPKTMSLEWSKELRAGFSDALDGPNSKALLVIDQFEEVFSSAVDEDIRERFLDSVVDLANDPMQRFKILLTLRADFSDRPLSHPRFGDLISKGSMVLGPMRLDQIEAVIRRPAARVGVQVEPGLISEIIRDLSSSVAYLPLLQYLLSELFERRREDRLTVQEYRSLGGLNGVLERQAESTYGSLSAGGKQTCRQLFLRMVHLGEHGEETRRRLPLPDIRGLGRPGDIDEALDAFSAARLLTYDRDPVTRTPTVEVAHETVISRWTRLRIWIDEVHSDLLAHRRLRAAATTWTEASEDPSYLLTGGPLVSALELASRDRIELNKLEARFVRESQLADEEARHFEEERRREETILRQRARRRLTIGVVAVVGAVVVGLLALFAWMERQRANELASQQEGQSLARRLAAASTINLGVDPDLSLLLALEAAEVSLEAGEEVLPEAVDALHQAVIAPKPELIFERGTTQGGSSHLLLDWSADGSVLAVVDDVGGVTTLDPVTGEARAQLSLQNSPAIGIELHPNGDRALSIHADAAREWSLASQQLIRPLNHPAGVTVAAYARNGERVAVGGNDGSIRVWSEASEPVILTAHEGPVSSLSFSPEGERLVSGGLDGSILVWDLASGEVVTRGPATGGVPRQVVWAPEDDRIAVNALVDLYLFDALSGVRGPTFSSVNLFHVGLDIGPGGAVLASAGIDGLTRLFVMGGGGAPILEIPNGGVPLRDVAIDPSGSLSTTFAALDAEGKVKMWRDPNHRSELPPRSTGLVGLHIQAADGRYLIAGYRHIGGLTSDQPPLAEVIDTTTGNVLLQRPTHEHQTLFDREPAISSDGELVAFAGPGDPGGDIEIVEVDTGASIHLPGSANWTTALAFSDEGALLAGAGFDGSIAVWETATGELVEMTETADLPPIAEISRLGFFLPKVPATIEDIDFRPGSWQLAWARLDGRIGTWEIRSGDIRLLHELQHPAASVAYTSDGSRLAAADRSGEIVMFAAETGELTLVPESVAGLFELTFSADGRYLAGAGPAPHAYLWDANDGRLLRRFHGSFGAILSVAFVNEGTQLRVPGIGGFDRGYVLDPRDLVDIARGAKTRDLTEVECQRYLGRACGD